MRLYAGTRVFGYHKFNYKLLQPYKPRMINGPYTHIARATADCFTIVIVGNITVFVAVATVINYESYN